MTARSGRKPLPHNLRVIKGTHRADRHSTNTPQPEIELPPPPAFLDETAKAAWNMYGPQLRDLGCMSHLDGVAFSLLCTAWARWREAEDDLKASGGLLTKTTGGNVIQNPLVGIANTMMEKVRVLCSEFGMTPSARSKIDTEAAKRAQQIDPAEKYFDD